VDISGPVFIWDGIKSVGVIDKGIHGSTLRDKETASLDHKRGITSLDEAVAKSAALDVLDEVLDCDGLIFVEQLHLDIAVNRSKLRKNPGLGARRDKDTKGN
jgi:hypothetical protein